VVLTERQERVLTYMYDYTQEYGFVPAIREICDDTRINSTSLIIYYMKQLEELGYLIKSPVKSRAYRLTGKTLSLLGHINPETDIHHLQQQVKFLKAENEKLKQQNAIKAMQLAELTSPQLS
jgi:SOS-response transcriptional repressor LexA